jgi:hypothetical protein
MPKKTRTTSTFSLSFLDIMSCGLGAAVLIFLLLKHVVDSPTIVLDPKSLAEVSLLEDEILQGELQLVRIRNTISELSDETVVAQGLADRITEQIQALRSQLPTDATNASITSAEIKARLVELEQQKSALENTAISGSKAYEFSGDGQRQYLTGLRMSGRNVLILIDSSASMLDDTIVNIVRRRSLPDAVKNQSPKWLRSKAITQWVIANLPLESDFQVLSFNSSVTPVVDQKANIWYRANNRVSVAKAVQGLDSLSPNNGTNLEKVIEVAMSMRPLPDNIFLITDGLPTLARGSATKGAISGRDRMKLFYRSIQSLAPDIPVNTILLPLEGDPYAAGVFWHLAQISNGSFLTPARGWP